MIASTHLDNSRTGSAGAAECLFRFFNGRFKLFNNLFLIISVLLDSVFWRYLKFFNEMPKKIRNFKLLEELAWFIYTLLGNTELNKVRCYFRWFGWNLFLSRPLSFFAFPSCFPLWFYLSQAPPEWEVFFMSRLFPCAFEEYIFYFHCIYIGICMWLECDRELLLV